MEALFAQRAPAQKHPPRSLDPMEAIRISDRGVCKFCSLVELQFLPHSEPDAESGLLSSSLPFLGAKYWYVLTSDPFPLLSYWTENANASHLGFMNFAILVGAIIGLFTAGPLSDYVSARSTRRNNGIREPEMRLPAMIPYIIIMYLGNIVVAVGYQHHWPWQAIVVIGFTCAGIQVAALPAIASTYAVDSYKPVAGSLFVSITVNKNVWGYGFSKFITPWAIKDG